MPPASARQLPPCGIVDRREAVRYALEQLCPGDIAAMRQGPEGYSCAGGEDPLRRKETVRSCARELLESRPQSPVTGIRKASYKKKETVRHKLSTHKDNMNCVQSKNRRQYT